MDDINIFSSKAVWATCKCGAISGQGGQCPQILVLSVIVNQSLWMTGIIEDNSFSENFTIVWSLEKGNNENYFVSYLAQYILYKAALNVLLVS